MRESAAIEYNIDGALIAAVPFVWSGTVLADCTIIGMHSSVKPYWITPMQLEKTYVVPLKLSWDSVTIAIFNYENSKSFDEPALNHLRA